MKKVKRIDAKLNLDRIKSSKMFNLSQDPKEIFWTGALGTEKAAWRGEEPLEPQQLGLPPTEKLQPRDNHSKIPPWEPFCCRQGVELPEIIIKGKQEQILLSPLERRKLQVPFPEKGKKCKERKER